MASEEDPVPNQILKESTLKGMREGIESNLQFRYILCFDTKLEAKEALDLAKECKPPHVTLYYRPICLTRDTKWRFYISNYKLQTYTILR